MKVESNSEEAFYSLLYAVLIGSKPVDALLENSTFIFKGRQICSRIQRTQEDNTDDADDLLQEACLRVWRYLEVLNIENIRSEDDFWKWFYVLARNISRTKWRKKTKQIDALQSIKFDVSDHRITLEDDLLLSEFEEFIKTLPRSHKIAITLWLSGCTYREISEALRQQLDFPHYSHVTVRAWIRKTVKDFLQLR